MHKLAFEADSIVIFHSTSLIVASKGAPCDCRISRRHAGFKKKAEEEKSSEMKSKIVEKLC